MSNPNPDKIKVGDEVAFSVQFLKSIGELTGDMPAARGKVTGIRDFGSVFLATVEWDREVPNKVNVVNLAHVGPNMKFANCD